MSKKFRNLYPYSIYVLNNVKIYSILNAYRKLLSFSIGSFDINSELKLPKALVKFRKREILQRLANKNFKQDIVSSQKASLYTILSYITPLTMEISLNLEMQNRSNSSDPNLPFKITSIRS